VGVENRNNRYICVAAQFCERCLHFFDAFACVDCNDAFRALDKCLI